MQKGSHLVCGMFMLVGAEKKYGLEERHVGPRQEKLVNAGHGRHHDWLNMVHNMTRLAQFCQQV